MLKPVGREFAWVVVGQLLAAAGGLVGVKLLTRGLAPAPFGELSLALTGIVLSQQCVGGPLGQAAIRYFSACREEQRTAAYLHALHRLMLKGSGMIVALGAVVFFSCAAAGYRAKGPLIALTVALALTTGYNIVFDAIQTGSRNRAVVAFHQAAIQWARPIAAFALIVGLSSTAAAAVCGYLLATLAVIGSQAAFLIPSRRFDGAAGRADIAAVESKLLDYAKPFATWGVLAWGQMASDRWFLEIFRGSQAVGAYTVSYQLGYYPMVLASTALGNLAGPIIYQIAGGGSDLARIASAARANRIHVWALVLLTAVATLGTLILHSEIFRLFTVPAFFPYSRYLPILALSAGVFAIAQSLSLVFLIRGRSDELTGTKCSTAVAGLLFNMAGAYWFGVAGAVAAALAFSLLYLATVLVLSRTAGSPAPARAWSDEPVVEA